MPDMLPLVRQIQIACDSAKFGIARLAGSDAPKMEDTETTLPELKARIQRTLDFIQSVPAADVEHSEERAIQVPLRGRDPLQFKGEDYLREPLRDAQLLFPPDHRLRDLAPSGC